MVKRKKSRVAKLAQARRRKKLAEQAKPLATDNTDSSEAFGMGLKANPAEVGSSGTDIIGGFLREETLPELQGSKGARIYADMRRREATVAMLMNAIKNPIYSANWAVQVEDESDPDQAKLKALVEWNLFKGLQGGWKQFLHEVFTFAENGFSVFEAITKTANVPELAEVELPDDAGEDDNADPEDELTTDQVETKTLADVPGDVENPAEDAAPGDQPELPAKPVDSKGPLVTYFSRFAFRKQESIFRWNLDRATGKIISITQITHGDTSKQTYVDIPGQVCLVFTHQKEGDNYEGVSILRPMYGAYKRKDLYLRLAAIGAERNAVGTVIGTMPASKTKASEKETFEEMLESFAGNESAYLLKPEGYTVEVVWGQFDPAKMVALLNFEDEQMAKAVCANFLALGTGGNAGSLALGGTLANFFLSSIQSLAEVAVNEINSSVIPTLCQMSYGPQKCYPKIACTGINDKAGKELADIIVALIGGQALTADMPLEEFLRKQYKLPKHDEATARKKPVPQLPGNNPLDPNAPPSDNNSSKDAPAAKDGGTPAPGADKKKDKASLAEKRKAIHLADYVKQFDKNKAATKAAMQKHLRVIADDFLASVKKKYEGLGDSQKAKAVLDIAPKQSLINAYVDELRTIAADVATQAIAQARKEVPKAAQKVKFGAYDRLNPLVKKAIESQINLVAETQAADLAKMVLFQWSSSASSSDDADAIEHDVMERLAPTLEGTSNSGLSIEAASGDLTAHVTQNSRNEFFFAPEVLDTIESFTFTNEDPVSEICQNLAGQTFLASDPAAEQFYPPLHHNCKSRLVPNGKDDGVEVTGIGITADTTEERQRLEKQITLSCCAGHKIFS